MARLNLKSIIGKDAIADVLNLFIGSTGSATYVEDGNGLILYGAKNSDHKYQHPVIADGVNIGMVMGDKNAGIIAELLSHLANKELERKKLGSEVLNLYKEINLIFNFSEKLASTIDAQAICVITLKEARHVINSDYGAIILLNETKNNPEVVTSSDELFFSQDKLNLKLSIVNSIISNGLSEIETDTSSIVEAGIVLPEVQSLIYSALKVNDRVMGAIVLGSVESMPYTAAHLKLLTTLALQASAAIESALLYEKNINEAREREEAMRLVYEATGKFVPYEFISSLGHNLITDVKLGDQVEKIVTVLFSDIRGYTTLSEDMTPEQNFKFVCSFNERMGPVIRRNKGFINQYLGDAIMAIFPDQASDALSAAIEMQEQLDELNLSRLENGEAPIRIGIGMHTGSLIMGITGDANRLDATTISDTVNIASRLESLTKYYKTNIILSDDCLDQIVRKEKFHIRHIGLVQLKGKHRPIKIHECFSGNLEKDIVNKERTLAVFNEGMDNYLNKQFDRAVESFLSVSQLHPEDHTAAFFLANAKQFLKKGAPDNWTGVLEMESK